ncbi:MAG: alpha/beta fold hydrolase [Micromonosporaceae bacterium]|nr:alpha/beta fold hydrolase [Micromonosporaceae bacterium]
MKRARLAPDTALPDNGDLHPQWPGQAVLLDGRATYVRHTPPTGPAVEPALYVHGLGGSSQNWTDMAGLLAGRLDGLALDLPGFGRSEPAKRYTLAALADRVVSVIEHCDRGPVHLFGNSLGGAVSVRVAATRPDLVRTLTLISPAMPFLDLRRSVQGRLVPLLLIPRVERIAARRLASMEPEQLARQVIDLCWADPQALPAERFAEMVEESGRRLRVPWYADAYVRTFRGLVTSFLRSYLPGSDSLWRLAARVTAPTLVIWGRQDRLVDVGLAPRVAGAIDDSRLLIIDQVGHVAQMERPREVARAVLGLLDEVADEGTGEAGGRVAGPVVAS